MPSIQALLHDRSLSTKVEPPPPLFFLFPSGLPVHAFMPVAYVPSPFTPIPPFPLLDPYLSFRSLSRSPHPDILILLNSTCSGTSSNSSSVPHATVSADVPVKPASAPVEGFLAATPAEVKPPTEIFPFPELEVVITTLCCHRA